MCAAQELGFVTVDRGVVDALRYPIPHFRHEHAVVRATRLAVNGHRRVITQLHRAYPRVCGPQQARRTDADCAVAVRSDLLRRINKGPKDACQDGDGRAEKDDVNFTEAQDEP
jgi:hypothetical protein